MILVDEFLKKWSEQAVFKIYVYGPLVRPGYNFMRFSVVQLCLKYNGRPASSTSIAGLFLLCNSNCTQVMKLGQIYLSDCN